MFKLDSPLMNFLSKIADIMILNLLIIICSIPVFTIGAAVSAAYYMAFKMVKNEETYIVRGFFKAFKAKSSFLSLRHFAMKGKSATEVAIAKTAKGN